MQLHAYAALSGLEVAEEPDAWVVVVRMCRHGLDCNAYQDNG